MSNENILEVKNLKKHFSIKAGVFQHVVGHVKSVDGISFEIKRGQTFGLVGEPNRKRKKHSKKKRWSTKKKVIVSTVIIFALLICTLATGYMYIRSKIYSVSISDIVSEGFNPEYILLLIYIYPVARVHINKAKIITVDTITFFLVDHLFFLECFFLFLFGLL